MTDLVCIKVGRENDRLAQRSRNVFRNILRAITLNREKPIVIGLRKVVVVRLIRANADATMWELAQKTIDTFETIQMSLSRCCSESPHSHSCGCDVKSPQSHHPKHAANE